MHYRDLESKRLVSSVLDPLFALKLSPAGGPDLVTGLILSLRAPLIQYFSVSPHLQSVTNLNHRMHPPSSAEEWRPKCSFTLRIRMLLHRLHTAVVSVHELFFYSSCVFTIPGSKFILRDLTSLVLLEPSVSSLWLVIGNLFVGCGNVKAHAAYLYCSTADPRSPVKLLVTQRLNTVQKINLTKGVWFVSSVTNSAIKVLWTVLTVFQFTSLQRRSTNRPTLRSSLRHYKRNRCYEAKLKDYTHQNPEGKSPICESISCFQTDTQGNNEFPIKRRLEALIYFVFEKENYFMFFYCLSCLGSRRSCNWSSMSLIKRWCSHTN